MGVNLTPSEIEGYFSEKREKYKRKGNKIELDRCIFCGGGKNKDPKTMAVFLDEGNFQCLRSSCGKRGTFWQIAEFYGDNPKMFFDKDRGNVAPAPGHTYEKDYDLPAPTPSRSQREVTVIERAAQARKREFTKPHFELEPLTPRAADYLEKRGFGAEALELVDIGGDGKGNIAFVYYHDGELCLVKFRRPGKPAKGKPKAWQAGGGLGTLWGIDTCTPTEPLIITFGEYDRMALLQAGVSNAVSVPFGDNDLNWIDICWDKLAEYKQIILWADNDESGMQVVPKIANRLGKERILTIITGRKDANEVLFHDGEEAVYAAVASAEWYWESALVDIASIEYDDDEDEETFGSGFPALDHTLGGFRRGALTVHVGSSGQGKSSALAQLVNASVYQDIPVCAWSGEDRASDFKRRVHHNWEGSGPGVEHRLNRWGRVIPYFTEEGLARFDAFAGGSLFLYDARSINEDQIVENFRIAFERFGCEQFIVDNLMKLVDAKETEFINQRQTRIVNALSDFAKDTGTHIHLAAHTNKTGRDDEPPTKASVAGAKEITNLADNVVAWWRIPDSVKQRYEEAQAMALVLKSREHGELGEAYYYYTQQIRRFAEEPDQWDVFSRYSGAASSERF